jgi:hypothetical protein
VRARDDRVAERRLQQRTRPLARDLAERRGVRGLRNKSPAWSRLPSDLENNARTSGWLACGESPLTNRAMRFGTAMPSSASRIAGSNSLAQGNAPCRACAAPSITMAPGTPVERPDSTASRYESGSPLSSRNMPGVAPFGAASRPLNAVTFFVAAS